VKPARDLGIDREALTVAMAVVPGFYSRNKHHAFYADLDVRRARARAWAIRGAARQLAGASGAVSEVVFDRGDAACRLAYRVEGVRLLRQMALTRVEGACLAYLAARAGASVVACSADDRALVDASLRRLSDGGWADELADGTR
jgi:hypothetical protein